MKLDEIDGSNAGATTRGREVPACPVAHGRPFDPFEEEQARDPFPWLERAQLDQPVFYLPEYRMWCVTRYDDVLDVIRDVESFSSESTLDTSLHPDIAALFPHGHPMKHAMIVADRPRHTRLRKAAQPNFTPRAIKAQTALVRDLANALIDEFESNGRCDFVEQYSNKLPLQVVVAMCGLPLATADKFAEINNNELSSGEMTEPVEGERRVAQARRSTEFRGWLEGIVAERREVPRNDVTSALVHACNADGGPALEVHEVVAQLENILAAGSFTTATAIPTMVLELLRHPEQWAALVADRTLIEAAVEESLRASNPVRGVIRMTTTEVNVGSVTIPANEQVYIHFGAAQRDPAVFQNPHAFDISRDDVSKHFGFGRGTHMCLGAPLARLEMQITLECLLERLHGLRLAPDYEEHWRADLVTPDLLGLALEWDVPAVDESARS